MVVWAHTSDRRIDPQRPHSFQIWNPHSFGHIDLFNPHLPRIPINQHCSSWTNCINSTTYPTCFIDYFGKLTTHYSDWNCHFGNEILNSWGVIRDEGHLVRSVHHTVWNHYSSDSLHLWWSESEILNNFQKDSKPKNQRRFSCYVIFSRNLPHHWSLIIC